MNRTAPCALLALSLLACSVDAPTDGDDLSDDDDLGVAAQAQLDPGNFDIIQNGVNVGGVWRGRISTGVDVEYWAKKSTYVASAARTFKGTSAQTCAAFRTMVCGWSGATRLRSTVAQSPLVCGAPPSTITAPGGASSFLAAGSYRTTTAAGVPFAYTYVSGNVEYWAMNNLVPSTPGTQSPQAPLSPPYASFASFVSTVCALPSPPSQWISQYLTNQPSFCTANPC